MSRITRLGRDLGNEIRAPGLMPSFHTIVEELILNSLDAGSTTIRIKCDLSKYDVEVFDNGVGIREGDMDAGGFFGQWQTSSKTEKSGLSFGFRGEAIATISHLSDLTVISKAKGNTKTLSMRIGKDMRANHVSTPMDPFEGEVSGTLCGARNIFGKLPVRQRAIKKSLEISRVKQFVEKMALLHHNVRWTFECAGQRVPLVQLPSAFSVASRFASMTSTGALSKMVSIDVECKGMRLVGLVSPPLSECCHYCKEYQFFYLERRWMKGNDFVSQIIHKTFSEYLERLTGVSNNARGPNPKHAVTGDRAAIFPLYILQLLCAEPGTEYDLLAQPDKTIATFAEPTRVLAVVETMLKELVRKYCQKNLDDLGAVLQIPVHENADNLYKVREGKLAVEKTNHVSSAPNFRMSFLTSPSNDLIQAHSTENDFVYDHEYIGVGASAVSLDIICEENTQFEEVVDKSGAHDTDFFERALHPEGVTPLYYEESVDSNYDLSSYICDENSGIQENSSHFESTFLQSPLTKKDITVLEQDRKQNSTTVHHVLKETSKHISLHGSTTAVILSKHALQKLCSIVGQADNKYIILRVGKFLVAADQHAVDERIRLEQTIAKYSSGTVDESVTLQPVTLFVGSQGITVARDRQQVLSNWGFSYSFCAIENHLQLKSVPLIDGEALNEADFVEFLHLLGRNNGPDELCRPPAVSRIFASHACRQSIKFGDVLTPELSLFLMEKLKATDMPFQCAHGRVSMTPLLDLHALDSAPDAFAMSRKRRMSLVDQSARSKPKYERLYEL